jgi:DNA-binding GntR family transcriptional regulator
MAQQKTGNAQQLIYSSLRNSILSLNLIPGTVITENDISQRFNVSRTPVREAFIALSKEALVTVMPQRGSIVSHIDFARVEQELFLRENLESAALKRFLKNHDPSHLAELEKYIELQAVAAADRKFEQFYQYDDQFHHVFFAGQDVAWEALENMCGHYHRVRLLTIWLQNIVEDIVKEHKALFKAVKQRDAVKALSLLDSHIHKLNTEEAMLKRLFPDFFIDSTETPPAVDFGGLNIN